MEKRCSSCQPEAGTAQRLFLHGTFSCVFPGASHLIFAVYCLDMSPNITRSLLIAELQGYMQSKHVLERKSRILFVSFSLPVPPTHPTTGMISDSAPVVFLCESHRCLCLNCPSQYAWISLSVPLPRPDWLSVSLIYFFVCPFVFFPSLSLPMMTSSNGKIFHVTGPLCGEFTGHRWTPLTKASDAELWCFLWSASELTLE